MPQHTAAEYRKLLRDYQELQLRVTRFAHVEQQLRNTQDKLDQEIILYKRLSAFGAVAFKSDNISVFLQTAVESLIDILEVEAAAILLIERNSKKQLLFSEGFESNNLTLQEQLSGDILKLGKSTIRKKSLLLTQSSLESYSFLQNFVDGLFQQASEEKLGVSVYIIGLVSNSRAPFYDKLTDKHEVIFSLFAQQFLSILTNLYQNSQIQEQFNRITRSEVELRKLSLIAKRTKNGVIITNKDQVIEWVNESYSNSTGYTFKEVVGRKTLEMLNLHSVDYADRKKIMRAVQNNENIELKIKSNTKWGAIFYCQIETIPVLDEKGTLVNNIFVFKDITDETRFKNEILRINSRLQLIVNEAKVGIWEWNKVKDKSVWNDVLYEQYSLEKNREEINFYEFWKNSIHPEDLQQVMANRQKINEGKLDSIKQHYRIINQKGEVRYINSATIAEKDARGQIISLVGSSLDVTDLINIDEKLNRLKLFYENILNHLPSQVVVLNERAEIVYLNEAMEQANPFLADFIDKSIHQIETSGKQTQVIVKNLQKYFQIALTGKEPVSYNETFIVKRKRMQLLGTALPFWLAKDHVHIILSFTDVTQLNRFQKDILRKNTELQKVNSELDNFVYRVSHDLRSPLLSIKGILGLLEFESTSTEMKEYHHLIDDSVTRMDFSIKDILEYSRNSRLDVKKESINIRKMVEEIFDDIKFSSSLPIVLEFEQGSEEFLFSDALRINVLLKNLIGNSVKYRRNISESFIRFGMETKKNYIQITIADNGKGIAKKKIKKVFDMFYRGSSDSLGSGLGLYICREIITKLKGKIFIESELDQGTRVIIQLPLKKS